MTNSDQLSDREFLERIEHGNTNQRAAFMILNAAAEAPHHRQWYLDQALRILAGSEYRRLIAAFESLTSDDWDTGIAP